jgi:hypothetical protein
MGMGRSFLLLGIGCLKDAILPGELIGRTAWSRVPGLVEPINAPAAVIIRWPKYRP